MTRLMRAAVLLTGAMFAALILGALTPATAAAPANASSALPSLQGTMIPAAPASSGAKQAPTPTMGCGFLDALCNSHIPLMPIPVVPSVAEAIDIGKGVAGGVEAIANPMESLGGVVAKAAADVWTAAMLSIWSAGLFALRIVLTLAEMFLTPDLRADGPGRPVYEVTLWMSLTVVVMVIIWQLGVAALKRDGKSLARALIGAGQYAVIYSAWFGWCALVIAACGGLTRYLMKSLLSVKSWPEWDPLGDFSTQNITDATVATVLALMGIFLWLAAIGHLLVYLARAASLLILVATGPVAAAGLPGESTRMWFWKTVRWFHAAALSPVLMILVMGIGVQMATGVSAHLADGAQKAIGTALPAVMTILVGVVAPLALFKLLAFVDPGTPSGASFRQGMAAAGGLQGLLSGGGAGGGSSVASSADSSGRSSGESNAESATGDRFNKSTQGALAAFGGVGAGLAAGMGMVTSAGAKAASLMGDETNQAGVGHQTYGPDFSAMSNNRNNRSQTHPFNDGDSDSGAGGDDEGAQSPFPPDGGAPPPPPPPPATPAGGHLGGGASGSAEGGPGAGGPGGAAGAGSGTAAGGAAGGGAAVPIVPA